MFESISWLELRYKVESTWCYVIIISIKKIVRLCHIQINKKINPFLYEVDLFCMLEIFLK